jgi:adiponectin receptor
VTETLSKTLNRSFHSRQSAAHCETSHDGSGSKLPEPHQPQKLITISDLPSWYHDNPFVLSGYRPISNSTAKCVESLLYIHNETANIYTHLIAAVIFILAQSALQRYLTSLYPTIEIGDRLAIAFEGSTAAICFILSATYHSLICHSEPIFRLSLKCDYAGIIILIIGNFLSGLHISFHCAPTLARIYSFMVSFPRLSFPSRQAKMYQILSLGSTTSFIVLSPSFQGPNYFGLRLKAFIITGLSGFLPVIHAFVHFGPATFLKLGGNWYLLEGKSPRCT